MAGGEHSGRDGALSATLRLLLARGRDAALVLDRARVIVDASPPALTLLGRERAQLVGRGADELFEEAGGLERALAGIERGEPCLDRAARLRRGDGSVIACELSAARERDAVILLLRARAEGVTALRDAGLLEAIIQNSSAVIYVKDLEGRLLLVNRHYERALGLERAQVLGRTDSEFFPAEIAAQHREHDLEVLSESREWEERAPHEDGIHTYISVKFPIVDGGGRAYAVGGISTDITERKRGEAALRASEAQAQAALERLRTTQQQLVESEKMAALGGLVAGVAHEINTPIGIGITGASLLEQRTRELAAQLEGGGLKRKQLRRYLETATETSEMILANLQRAGELIQSFKQVAVDQSSEGRRRFEVHAYLRRVLISLRPELRRRPVTALLTGARGLKIVNYPGALAQVVTNLVMNSLTHAFAPGEAGTIEITLAAVEGSDTLALEFADDGRGIPRENLAKIFEPFFTTQRGRGGTGLGLHLVYNLVTQRMGGTIRCESAPGQGARFFISLPSSSSSSS